MPGRPRARRTPRGSPSRPIGIDASSRAWISAGSTPSRSALALFSSVTRSVAVYPGSTVLTVIPSGATSRASVRDEARHRRAEAVREHEVVDRLLHGDGRDGRGPGPSRAPSSPAGQRVASSTVLAEQERRRPVPVLECERVVACRPEARPCWPRGRRRGRSARERPRRHGSARPGRSGRRARPARRARSPRRPPPSLSASREQSASDGALGRQLLRDRAADSTAGAADERDLALEAEVHVRRR